MNTLPIIYLTGTALVGGYTVNLEGRAEAPESGTIIWYRQYRTDPKTNRWLPTGRPRKMVFRKLIRRDERDDCWECSDWKCYLRGLHGITIIGSKSLYRIAGHIGDVTRAGAIVGRVTKDRMLNLWKGAPARGSDLLFHREADAVAYVLNAA